MQVTVRPKKTSPAPAAAACATLLSFIESARLHDLNPYAYLRDVLTRLPSAKARDLDSLLPHLWQPR